MHQDIYKTIATRTNGDIYIGVVGPVRTGKSTFVTQFAEKVVLPKIKNKYEKARVTDELPQSADGKTIMTTQPKFVPAQAVKVNLKDKVTANVRLVDCVGYYVEEAFGYSENENTRLVKTPWSAESMPFEQAAEMGTRKVITDHSTIAIVVTTDGTVSPIGRPAYVEAEQKVIEELIELGKPFVVLVNSRQPQSEQCKKISSDIEKKYQVTAICVDVSSLTAEGMEDILRTVLDEFALTRLLFNMPKWMRSLPADNALIADIASYVRQVSKNVKKMKDSNNVSATFTADERLEGALLADADMSTGVATYNITPKPNLFFDTLSNEADRAIEDEYSLMSFVTECAYAKKQYDAIKDALQSVQATGYGVVAPKMEQMTLLDPEIVKSGSRFGVKLRASAPSLHIMQIDVATEVNPIVGTEQQSQYLLSEFQNDPKSIWNTDMFGKSMSGLARDALAGKLAAMPTEVQEKMRRTISRIVNEGKGGVICLLL